MSVTDAPGRAERAACARHYRRRTMPAGPLRQSVLHRAVRSARDRRSMIRGYDHRPALLRARSLGVGRCTSFAACTCVVLGSPPAADGIWLGGAHLRGRLALAGAAGWLGILCTAQCARTSLTATLGQATSTRSRFGSKPRRRRDALARAHSLPDRSDPAGSASMIARLSRSAGRGLATRRGSRLRAAPWFLRSPTVLDALRSRDAYVGLRTALRRGGRELHDPEIRRAALPSTAVVRVVGSARVRDARQPG